jgi:hypothetical protein
MNDRNRQKVTFTIPLNISISLGPIEFGTGGTPLGVTPDGLKFATSTEGLAARFSREFLASTTFTWQTALSLALASKLAYASPSEVRSTAISTWGLSKCQFFEANDTQCFVCTTPDVALISFRGTESIGDWLADLNARSHVRPFGAIHRGFYHAFQDVRSQLQFALENLGGLPLLLTGHSLGGALATVAAAEWQGRYEIQGVYTYGQPRCGNNKFNAFMNKHFGDSFHRFVNDDDIVTRVPPGFRHVGRLYHFDASGKLQDAQESLGIDAEYSELPPLTEAEFDHLRAQLLAARSATPTGELTPAALPMTEGFFPSFFDHRLDGYISKIQNQI